MKDDQKKDPTLLPIPTKRLRALLRQSNLLLQAIKQACERRQLPRHAWKQFMWNDNDCDTYSRRLEYGCNDHDDIHRPGVDNVHQFIEQLLENATFESTGRPVPPPKDSTGAAGNVVPTNQLPALIAAPVDLSSAPRYHDNFNESPVTNAQIPHPSSQLVSYSSNVAPGAAARYRARTVYGLEIVAQQSNNQASSKSKMMPAAPQKRHPSLDSASHPENSSRAKRNPATDKLALPIWNIDRPDSAVLPAQNPSSLIGTDILAHSAATANGDGQATECPGKISDHTEMNDSQWESVTLGEVHFGDQFSFETFENEQGYSNQPWAGDQTLFSNQQSFGTQHVDQEYFNNDHRPCDSLQVYNHH